MAEVIVVASGKSGVGKTTAIASIACGLARAGHQVAVIDFDVGQRNLDLVMGCERRVVYDFVNVLRGEASLKQALIRDRHCENLQVLAASQTRDKDALTTEGVARVIKGLAESGFDYILCDAPAGFEKGAFVAMYFADRALVVVNPDAASVRDSERVLGLLAAKSRRAESGDSVRQHLLLNRYDADKVEQGVQLSAAEVETILGIPVIGVVPESADVQPSAHAGVPVILDPGSDAGLAYADAVARLLGEDRPMRFAGNGKKGFLARVFGS